MSLTTSTSLPICKLSGGSSADRYYFAQPANNADMLTRKVFDQQTPAQGRTDLPCTVEDCTKRLAEKGLQTQKISIMSDQKKTCNATFDCNVVLPSPSAFSGCPVDPHSCCTKNGALTGQVCIGKDGGLGVCGLDGETCGDYGNNIRVLIPRCATGNDDPNNPKCLTADQGFDANNCAIGTGCQKIKDTFYWNQFTGDSVHYNSSKDNDSCVVRDSVNGAYRDPSMTDQYSTDCEDYMSNYCYVNDLTLLPQFRNIDTTGLTNLAVSGVSLVNPITSGNMTYYYKLTTDGQTKEIDGASIDYTSVLTNTGRYSDASGGMPDIPDGTTYKNCNTAGNYSVRVFDQPSPTKLNI